MKIQTSAIGFATDRQEPRDRYINTDYRLGGTPYPGESAEPPGLWMIRDTSSAVDSNIIHLLGGTQFPLKSARPPGVWIRAKRHDRSVLASEAIFQHQLSAWGDLLPGGVRQAIRGVGVDPLQAPRRRIGVWLRKGVGVWLKSKPPEDAGPRRPEPRTGSQSKVCNVNSIEISRTLRT